MSSGNNRLNRLNNGGIPKLGKIELPPGVEIDPRMLVHPTPSAQQRKQPTLILDGFEIPVNSQADVVLLGFAYLARRGHNDHADYLNGNDILGTSKG